LSKVHGILSPVLFSFQISLFFQTSLIASLQRFSENLNQRHTQIFANKYVPQTAKVRKIQNKTSLKIPKTPPDGGWCVLSAGLYVQGVARARLQV
jgi:hypothetical protein